VLRARGTAQLLRAIPNPTAQLETDNLAPTYKVTAVQQFGWLLRNPAERAAGRAGVDRARADSTRILAETDRDVRLSFYSAVAADRELALALEHSLLADSLAMMATRRAAAGDISDLERDQVKLEASRATLAAAQSRESALVARAELARAVAWDRDQLPIAAGALDDGLADGALIELRRLASEARPGTIPTVRAAIADSTAAAARLRSAQIARIPFPGLLVGREWGGIAGGGSNAIIGAAMPIPLWNFGGPAVRQARGTAQEQAALVAEARLTATAQLVAARSRLDERAQRARVARDSLLPEARRIRAGAVRLYESGRTSLLPVLDALRAERDVARVALAEQLAFQAAQADLNVLIGRTP